MAGTLERRARAQVGEVDWAALLAGLEYQRLVPLLGGRVLEAAGTFAAFGLHPGGHAATISARDAGGLLELTTLSIATALEAAGVANAPLKGPLLARALHGDPGMRYSRDIDVLVARENFGRAVDALAPLGWRRAPGPGQRPGAPPRSRPRGRPSGHRAALACPLVRGRVRCAGARSRATWTDGCPPPPRGGRPRRADALPGTGRLRGTAPSHATSPPGGTLMEARRRSAAGPDRPRAPGAHAGAHRKCRAPRADGGSARRSAISLPSRLPWGPARAVVPGQPLDARMPPADHGRGVARRRPPFAEGRTGRVPSPSGAAGRATSSRRPRGRSRSPARSTRCGSPGGTCGGSSVAPAAPDDGRLVDDRPGYAWTRSALRRRTLRLNE